MNNYLRESASSICVYLRETNNIMKKTLWLIFIYLLLIFRHGYEYGRSDQIEILPYALKMAGIQNYTGDFFTDAISQVVPNERFMMAAFLSVFGNSQEIAVFLLHIVITLCLIAGMLRIAEHFLQDFHLAIIAFLLTQIVFFYWNLGGNELYGNDLQGSTFAEVLAVWAIVFFIEKKYIQSFSLLTIGIGFQAIAALQVVLLMAGVLTFEQISNLLKGQFSLDKQTKSIFISLLIFGIFGLGYIFWIKKASDGASISANEAQAIFDITFRFRNPHHFMPSAFSLKGWLLMPICAGASLYFFRKNKDMMLIFAMAGSIILLYTIGVEIFESRTIASFQAYKMTIWLKFLGIIAVWGIIKSKFSIPIFKIYWEKSLLIAGISLLLGIIFLFPSLIPYPISFDFKKYKERGEEVAICQAIQAKTPLNAVFITPFSFTEVPIYAKRAAYISYKANMRHAPHIFEWANRLQTLYGLDYVHKKWDIDNAPTHYENLSEAQLIALQKQGVTHAIFQTEKPYLQEVTRTAHYFVYALTNNAH